MNNFFIVGVGRSGTSLLQSMLNAHSHIALLPETQFLRNYVISAPKRSLDLNGAQKFLEILNSDAKFSRAGVAPIDVINKSKNPTEIYQRLLYQYGRIKGKNLIGDKDPRIIDYLKELFHLKLNPKIIHIMRDPRAVVASRMNADWSKNWPFFMHVFLYKAQFERGRKLGKLLFKDAYHELYYEDLIENPKHELDQICNLLKIKFQPEMLSFQNSARELLDAKEYQWKKETTGPLLITNNEKWKDQLSVEQIYMIERICANIFTNHPFRTSKNLSPHFKTFLITQFMIPVSWIFKTLYPIRSKLKK